jgi:ABC-type sugar transport system ATPase subunit
VSVDGVTGGTIKDVSFALNEGEVLGLTGLVGSGFEELLYQMFGATPAQSGRMSIAGVEHGLAAMSPPAAIKAGMALIPADRQGAAGIGSLLVRENVMMQTIDHYRPYRLDRGRYLRDAENALREYDVRPPEPIMDFQALSGGNQQKVVLAKWLLTQPAILILDEPTRGIDVGAKFEIYNIMNELVEHGVAIVMISSELPEVLGMSDRILVLHEGRLTGDLPWQEATQEKCMYYATGGK